MSIALPGSQNLFSLIQIDLYKNSRSRIALHKGVHDALDKFRRINNDIYYRPTRIAELFPLLYSAKGYHYTSGLGAVGSLFSSPYLVPWEGFDMWPLLWCFKWPLEIIDRLVTEVNPQGTITGSDLEISGGLHHLDALAWTFDIREWMCLSKTDNIENFTGSEREIPLPRKSQPIYFVSSYFTNDSIATFLDINIFQENIIPWLMNSLIFSILQPPKSHTIHTTVAEWLSTLATVQANSFLHTYGLAHKAVKSEIYTGRAHSANSDWNLLEQFSLDLALRHLLETSRTKYQS